MLASTSVRKIDPGDRKLNLAGFAQRTTSNEQIGSPELYTKILWIESGDSALVIISLDTLYFPNEIAEAINKYCLDAYGICKDNIIYNATHTHSAPSIALRHFGHIDQSYVDMIIAEIIAGIENCAASKNSASYRVRSFPAGNKIIGRRRVGRDIRSLFFKKKMLLLPNPDQKIDADIRIIELLNDCGHNIASVVNFSCHPVIANTTRYSSDFPGEISKKVSNSAGGEVFFLQGFCGDIRPNLTTNKVPIFQLVSFLKIIFNKVVFKVPNQDDFMEFCEDIVSRILKGISEKVNLEPVAHIKTHSFKHELVSQSGGTKVIFNTKIILLGRTLLVSIPAEVNSTYAVKLKEKFPDYMIFPLGYAEGMIGYLPYFKEIPEGGYEVNSASNYGWDTQMSVKSIKIYYNKLISHIKALSENKSI